MSEYFGGKARRKAILGAKLDRATAALPASTYGALFTIVNGRVILTSLVGEVTTVIQTQACNLKVTSTPTTGTAVDIATNLDIGTSPDEVGCLYGIGAYVGALVGTNAGATTLPTYMIVIPVGTLGITTSATNTGSIKWTATYIPLDDGAEMTVA
uniref:Uncharacterized protein n=1 Tax=viral metagenome TaxID=1070528 RepID=A0A6M3LFX4_9ZZZZ